MRWPIFIAAALVALVADLSLMPGLQVAGISPRLLVVLVVFVAMHVDPQTANWSALIAGLLADLSDPSMTGPRAPLYILGPHAIGMLFGVQAVVGLRGIVIRRNPLSIGALCFVMSIAEGLVWVGWWTLRSWYPDSSPPWGDGSSLAQVGRQFLQALSTAVIAIPVGWALIMSTPFWGFASSTGNQRTQGGTARMSRE